MEFPELGEHCFKKDCKRLDFLPMKCDACLQIFCDSHIQYVNHSCTESYKKDNQVPVCPLCNKPIPVQKGQQADVVVGRHIDSDCQSDPAKERRKVYTNKCSKKGCKVKEMIPVKCDKCHLNYCLRHRFEDDHECQGFQGSGQGITNAGFAALFRQSKNTKPASKPASTSRAAGNQKPQQAQRSNHSLTSGLGSDLNRQRQERQQQQQTARAVNQSSTEKQLRAAQAGMSEEELLAQAIQQSMAETSHSNTTQTTSEGLTQEEEDRLLAQALAASEDEARRHRNNVQRQTSEDKRSCQVS